MTNLVISPVFASDSAEIPACPASVNADHMHPNFQVAGHKPPIDKTLFIQATVCFPSFTRDKSVIRKHSPSSLRFFGVTMHETNPVLFRGLFRVPVSVRIFKLRVRSFHHIPLYTLSAKSTQNLF